MAAVRDRTGCHTECGRRPVNQDAVLAVRLADGRELVAVADGMGGHSAGEVASERALETVWSCLKAGLDLREAVSEANRVIHASAAENPAWTGMGTTLVALLRAGNSYEIANVGDSRAYRVTSGYVRQITVDHSFAAEALRQARVGTDDITRSPWRNALTRALGTDADVEVDVFGPFDAREPHGVLLCSDGLHRAIPDEALQQHVNERADPWTLARSLTDEAYRNGSTDNISAAVVLFGEEATPAPRAVPPRPRQSQGTAARPRPSGVVVQRRRRRKSRRARRTELQLVLVLVLLAVVVAALMRAW